ncbi:MAG: hypothetical protein Kapaf2KO_01000 [Candidatus Kapaibacteriales bacterium]
MNAKARLLVLAAFMAGMLGLGNTDLLAAAITSAQTGNWNSTSTWVGGVIPDADDDVTIAATHTVTVNAAVTAQSITVAGTLRPDISPSRTIDVGGNVTVDATGSVLYNNSTGRLGWTISENATIANAAGQAALQFNNLTIAASVASAVDFSVYGNMTVTAAGTFAASAGEVIFQGAGNKTINNDGALTFFNVEIPIDLNVSTDDGFVLAENLVIAAGAELELDGFSTLSVLGSAGTTLDIDGDLTVGADATLSISGASTIDGSIDNMSGTVTLGGVAITLGSSTISGTGTVNGASGLGLSLVNTSGVAGALATSSVSLNAVTDYTFTDGTSVTGFSGAGVTSVRNLTVAHTAANATVNTDESFTITGNLDVSTANSAFNATAGTITFGGNGTIDNGGGAIADLQLNDIVVGAGFTSTVTTLGFTSLGDITINGTLDMNSLNIDIAGETTLTNSGTFTYTGDLLLAVAASNLTIASNITQGAGGALVMSNAGATLNMGTSTITSDNAGDAIDIQAGTVRTANVGGVVASIIQTAASNVSYDAGVNFIFEGAATTLGMQYGANLGGTGVTGANITSVGNLTLGGTTVVTAIGTGAGLTIAGNLTVNSGGSMDLDAADNAEDITMSGTATIANSGTLALEGLTVSGTITTTSSFSIADILTVSGSLVASSPSVITNTAAFGNIVSPENTGTLTFFDVVFNSANTFTPGANGDYTVANDFTLSGGGSYTPTDAGATVIMTGTAAEIIDAGAGAVTMGELQVNGTTSTTAPLDIFDGGTLDVDGTFNITDALTFGGGTTLLTGTGTLNAEEFISGNDLDITGNLAINVTANVSGNDLGHTGSGDFTFTGTAAQTMSVTTYAPNSVVIPSTADVNFTTATANTNTPNIDLDGIWDVDAAADITGGTLDIAETATIEVGVAGGLAATITGAGTINASSLATYIFDAAGAVDVDVASVVNIDGAASVPAGELNSLGNVTLAAAMTTDDSFTINRNLIVSAGNSLDATAGTVTLAGSAGTIDNQAALADLTFFNLTVSGGYTFDAGSNDGFDIADGGVLTNSGSFNGAGQTVQLATTAANAIVNSASDESLVFGTLNYNSTNAASTASSFYINEAFNVNAAFTATAGTIYIGGTATVTNAAQATFNDLNVTAAGNATFADGTNGPIISNTLTVNGTLDVNGTADADRLTVDGGSITGTGTINLIGLVTATGPVTTDANITIDGDLATLTEVINAATALTASSPSTITIASTGANAFLDAGAATSFYNLTITGADVNNDADYTMTGNLTVENGADFDATAGTVTFDGGTDKSIINNGTDEDALTFFDFDIANTASNNVQTISSFTLAGTSADSWNLVGSTGGTFTATNGKVVLSGAAGGITNGSDVSSRAQFFGLEFTGATNTIAVGDVISVSGDLTFGNATSFTHTDDAASTITLNGSGEQIITVNKAMTGAVTLANLTLNNANGARVASSTATALVEDELVIGRRLLLNSGDLDLNGDNVVTIDVTNGVLRETAGNNVVNNGIPSSLGYIKAENAGGGNLVNNNIGGLGARVTTDADPGVTTIRRYHKPAVVGGDDGISRVYRIEAANASLNSTISLAYVEEELGSNNEADLLLFNSADINDGGANPWVNRPSTLDAANNNFRSRSINAFADSTLFWTIAAPDVVTPLEITGTTKGIAASPLTADRDSVVLYGLKLTPSGGEVDLDKLTFGFSRALTAGDPEFTQYRLVVSEDNNYLTTEDNTFLSVTATGGGGGQTTLELDLTTDLTMTEAVDYHFFLLANVDASPTAATAAVTVTLNNFGIGVNGGVVKTYQEDGAAYSFVPGYTMDYVSGGVSEAPIVAGKTNNVIFGYSISSTSPANFGGFTLKFSNDAEQLLTNPRVYLSTDASYETTANNSLINLSSAATVSGDSIRFLFNSAQATTVAPRYYFVVVDAKGGVDALSSEFTPSLMHTAVNTTTAQPIFRTTGYTSDIYTDVVTGVSYDFVKNTFTASLTNGVNAIPSMNGNISKGVVSQTVYGLTLTSDNGVQGTFTGLTADVALASSAQASDFNNWRLWADNNGNGFADSGEQLAIGTLNTAAGLGNLTFSAFSSAQNITTSKKYLITVDVRPTATAGGTVTVSVPSSAFIRMTSPAMVNNGGPYTAATQTVRTPGSASALAIRGNYETSVVTGGQVNFAIQAVDANGYPANVTSNTTVVLSLSNNDGGESSIGGTVTGSILNGRNYVSFSPTLTDADGSIVTTVQAADQAATLTTSAATQAITILVAEPTTDASALAVTDGATPSLQSLVNSWTNGNGSSRIIVVRANKAPAAPTDGIDYTPVNDIKNGYNPENQTGPGSYVVYDGSGASAAFTLTGLTPATKYYYAVYEYNGSGSVTNYKNIAFAATNPVSHTTSAGSFGTIADSTSAAVIETGKDITGTLPTTGDIDWYQFNVRSDKNNVLVRLTNLPANYTIELYDRTTGLLSDMTLIRKSEVSASGNETMILNAANAGRYLLKIYGNDEDQFSSSPYTLRVNTSANKLYSLPEGN